MTRPKRILDLFCGAGGASIGYSRAGFEVYGLDLNPMNNYPFPYHQGDAVWALQALLAGDTIAFRYWRVPGSEEPWTVEELGLSDFDAIHASPPCQAYSVTRHSHGVIYPELIEPVRDLLLQTGLPWVIENVIGAPMVNPVMLCGTMFGLTAEDVDGTTLELRRHRLFESNITIPALSCNHRHLVGGVYGGGSSRRSASRTDWPKGKSGRGGYTPHAAVRRMLMDLHHTNRDELSEAIPPAYTAHVGAALMGVL